MNRLIVAPIGDRDGTVVRFPRIQKELSDGESGDPATDARLGAIRERVTADIGTILAGIGETDGEAMAFAAMTRRPIRPKLAYDSMKLSDDARPDRQGIDLGALLSRVGAMIAHKEGRPGIRCRQTIAPVTVGPDGAVRVALLASEILSDAFRHAFDRLDEGVVGTRRTAGGRWTMVTDDGAGLPRDSRFFDLRSAGGRLIAALIVGLDATLSLVRGAAGIVAMIDVPAGVAKI